MYYVLTYSIENQGWVEVSEHSTAEEALNAAAANEQVEYRGPMDCQIIKQGSVTSIE